MNQLQIDEDRETLLTYVNGGGIARSFNLSVELSEEIMGVFQKRGKMFGAIPIQALIISVGQVLANLCPHCRTRSIGFFKDNIKTAISFAENVDDADNPSCQHFVQDGDGVHEV